MNKASGGKRDVVASGILLAGMLLAGRPCAFAADPSLDISQYAHKPWRVRDGFVKGTISSITQTPAAKMVGSKIVFRLRCSFCCGVSGAGWLSYVTK